MRLASLAFQAKASRMACQKRLSVVICLPLVVHMLVDVSRRSRLNHALHIHHICTQTSDTYLDKQIRSNSQF